MAHVVSHAHFATGLLATAIRVKDQPRDGLPTVLAIRQGVEHQFPPHVVCHRPVTNPAAEQTEHRAHVDPALSCLKIGDIRQPDLIWWFGMRG